MNCDRRKTTKSGTWARYVHGALQRLPLYKNEGASESNSKKL